MSICTLKKIIQMIVIVFQIFFMNLKLMRMTIILLYTALHFALSNYKTMQEIVRAYVNKRECPVQEVVYHVLRELHCVKFSQVCVLLIAIF